MQEIWRGITFEAYRYVPLVDGDPFYTSEHYQCFFRASGNLVRQKGHLAALDCLQQTVAAWVTTHWSGAILLPAGDEDLQARALRELPRAKRALIPTSCDLRTMAAFLLEVVCEEVLRDRGLLVTEVTLQRAGDPEPGCAAISSGLRELYLAEQAEKAGAM